MEPEASPVPFNQGEIAAVADPRTEVGLAVTAALGTTHADRTAYFEQLMRTKPELFHKWFVTTHPGSEQPSGRQMIVNVVNAIPKTALDGAPDGFRIR